MVSIAAIVVYIGLIDRRVLLWTVVGSTVFATIGVGLSQWAFGQPLPPSVYNPSDVDGRDIPQRFWNLMTSPSRGLLVYCPYLVMVGYLLVAYWKYLGIGTKLLLPTGLAIGAHTAVLSAYNGWYGGSCYGPRYFSDVLPWFVLATAIAVGGWLRSPRSGFRWRKGLEAVLLAGLVGWAVFVHSRGAISWPAWEWNHRALREDVRTAVMDWDHPQFLAGITFIVEPDGTYREL